MTVQFKVFLILLIFLFPKFAFSELKSLRPDNIQKIELQFGKNPKWTPPLLDRLIQYLINDLSLEFAKGKILENGELQLEVTYPSQLETIEWKGNRAVSTSEINNVFSYQAGEAFNDRRLVDSAERVRMMYVNKGYIDAQVEVELFTLSADLKKVILTVKEGTPVRIGEIEVITSNSNLQSQLLRITKSSINSVLENQQTDEITNKIRAYLEEKRYLRARVDVAQISNVGPSKVKLVFRISDPEQYFVEYKGVNFFSSGRLDDELALGSTLSTNPNFAAELANKVKFLYYQEGFSRVEVEASELAGIKSFEKKIVIKVKENARIRIQSFQMTGQFTQNQNASKNLIFKLGGSLLQKGYFSSEMLEKGLNEFVTMRRNLGFLQAQVLSQRATYTPSRDGVNIFVTFDEGPQTLIEDIVFQGNTSFASQDLLAQFSIGKNQALEVVKLEESYRKLGQFYRDQGYLEMILQNQNDQGLSFDSSQTKAKILVRIFEGPQVRVGSIRLEGLVQTRPQTVLRELDFKEGDILTPEVISNSIRRIQRLLNFSVEISTLEEKTEIQDRTVIVRITERDPGLFNFGMGATNERQLTLRGFAGVAYRNLFGTARAVSLRLEGNYNIANIQYLERKITLGYLEPYVLNTRTRGRVSLSNSSALDDTDTTLANEVTQTTFTLEKDFTSYFTTSWDVYSLATITDFNWKDDNIISSNRIASTAFNFDLDFRDHPFTPTKGTFSKLTLEYGAPGLGSSKTIEYFRSYAAFTHYLDVSSGEWIFANSLRGGYLMNLSQMSREEGGGVPYDKKGFSLGGQSTVRGLEPGEKFPNIFEFGLRDYLLQTNAKMAVIKSELRFPIYSNIGGALFYDGGFVDVSDDVPVAEGSSILVPFNEKVPDRYRDTVGVALRYNTPAGALSIETAWKLDLKRDRNESQLPILISFGTF